jgi:quercetin dioxygenase-like cupin family protein
MTEPNVPAVRRVITGHDADAKTKFLIDGTCRVKEIGTGIVRTSIWRTTESPADIAIGENLEDIEERVTPPPFAAGTRFLVFDFAPGARSDWHRSETIDYVIMIAGELDLELEGSSVTLRAGDAMVERGTNHSFVNRGSGWARFAVVTAEATPLGINPTTTRI